MLQRITRIRSTFTCDDQCQKHLDNLSLHPSHHGLRKPSTLALGSTDLKDVVDCILPRSFFPLRVQKRLSTSAQSSFHLRIPSARLSRSLVSTCGAASISRIRNLSFRYVSSDSSSVRSCSLFTNGFSGASLRLVEKAAYSRSMCCSSCTISSAPCSALAIAILWRCWVLHQHRMACSVPLTNLELFLSLPQLSYETCNLFKHWFHLLPLFFICSNMRRSLPCIADYRPRWSWGF